MFLHCAFRVVHDVWLMPKKLTFFRMRQYGLFWLKHSYYGDGCHIFPPTGLNLESAEISQPQITDVKIHPVVPKVYTYLIFFGPMEMANTSKNFGNALVGLRASNDAIHNFRRSVRKNSRKKKDFFGRLKKCCFFGPHLSDDGPKKFWLFGWLAIWLTRWLAGYLAIGFVAACLAVWVLTIWLAGWLDWHWLSGWLSEWLEWLALWLAIWLSRWLVGHLLGWLSGKLIGWWLARWVAD